MNRLYWSNLLATIGHLGYLPASGTMGSIFAFLFCFLFKYLGLFKNSYIELLVISVIIILSYYIIKLSFSSFNGNNDPKEIIIDEVAGCFIALYSLTSFTSLIYGLFIFRFFDITKVLGISWIEKKIKGPMGVLIDDLIAGIYTSITVKVLIYYGLV